MKTNVKRFLLLTAFICIFCTGNAYAVIGIELSFNPEPPFWPGQHVDVTATVFPVQAGVHVILQSQHGGNFAEGYTDNNGEFTGVYIVPDDAFEWVKDSYTDGMYFSAYCPEDYAYSNDIFCKIIDKPLFPVANFRSNVTEGYAPLTVQFTDQSENAEKWNWDFGNGSGSGSGSTKNPMHIYSTAGIYTVSLTVSNSNGQDIKTNEINVFSPIPLNNLMNVTVSSDPESVEPDELSRITVTVKSADGEGISGANVSLETNIGSVTPPLGKTDSSGKFTSIFTPSDKGMATIEAQVTKEGFNESSGRTSVDVEDSSVNTDADDEDSSLIIPLLAILSIALIGVVIYSKRPKPTPPILPVETALDVQIEPESIPADGKSTAKVIINLKDDKGNPIQSRNEKSVELSTTLGNITSPVKFSSGESKATTTITSGLEAGTAKVKVSSGLLKGEGKVEFTELMPVETALSIQIEPETIPADGKSTANVIIRIKDDKGNFVPSLKERTVELSVTLGTVTSQVTIPSGAKEGITVITSGEIAGTATVIASSSPLKEATAQVNFVSR